MPPGKAVDCGGWGATLNFLFSGNAPYGLW